MCRYKFYIYVFYFMHLNTFFWEGVRTVHQTLKGVLCTKRVNNPWSSHEISVYYHIPRCRNVQLASQLCSETVRIAIWLARQNFTTDLKANLLRQRPVYRRQWSSKCVRDIHDNSSMVRFQATTSHLNVTVGSYWLLRTACDFCWFSLNSQAVALCPTNTIRSFGLLFVMCMVRRSVGTFLYL